MRFSVLASGSRANCTYVEAAGKRFLIDCGLSGKQVALRLAKNGIDASTLDAIIVTHEHGDHIHGVSVLSRRYKLPVYVNEAAKAKITKVFAFESFETGIDFSIGDVQLHPFSIVHDAVDPVGFTIEAEGLKLSHFTDLGRVTPLVKQALEGSHAIVLEANHDKELLQICDYPWELKQRIASSHGHLSNCAAADCLYEAHHAELGQVVLGHLSENSNTQELALDTVLRRVRSIGFENISCGAPHAPSPLYAIGEEQLSAAV